MARFPQERETLEIPVFSPSRENRFLSGSCPRSLLPQWVEWGFPSFPSTFHYGFFSFFLFL